MYTGTPSQRIPESVKNLPIHKYRFIFQLLLGELTVSSGAISVGGKISYVSQEPWLFSESVRNNILFGQTYDKYWYNEVISVCALKRDFKELPYGDNTFVGDRGLTLSGGQKARINLARAIYRQASTYILDAPLAAVDPYVGRYLFEECICKHLKKSTRILVTHQVQYLKKVDTIVLISKVGYEQMPVGSYI